MNSFQWEITRSLRSKSTVTSLIFYFLFIAVACFYGKSFLEKQKEVISNLDEISIKNDQLYFDKRFKESEYLGRALYYLSNYVVHEPLEASSLSIGVRDLHSYHQVVRMRSLYSYLFDSGLNNPGMSSNGHFDLSFVLIFLLPLLIICSSYGVLSDDKENGMINLLKNTSGSLKRVVIKRLGVRFLLFLIVTLLSFSLVFFMLSLGLIEFYYWFSLTFCYISFWFGVVAIVISFDLPTTKNTAILLTLWTLFNLVLPSMMSIVAFEDRTKTGSMVMIKARQVVNNGWDIDKEVTAKKARLFSSLYEKAKIVEDKFNWSWYYAMQDVGDDTAHPILKQYLDGLRKDYINTLKWNFLIPSVGFGMILNKLAGTDQESHIDYYKAVLRAKDSMRESFLPRVIANERMSREDLLKLPQQMKPIIFKPDNKVPSENIVSYIVFCMLTLLFGFFRLRKLDSEVV